MAFQIVALTLDADDNVIERRVVPRPYPTREEAGTAIECIVSTFAEAGYEQAQKFCGQLLTMVTARGSSSKVSESPGPNRHLNWARRTSYRSCPAVVGRFRKQPRRWLPFRSSDRRIHWCLPV